MDVIKNAKTLLLNPEYCPSMTKFIIMVEILVNSIFLETVKFDERYQMKYIDWIKPLLTDNNWDYSSYKLSTDPEQTDEVAETAQEDPLYPPGHVYLYYILYHITHENNKVIKAIFFLVYIYTLYLVGRIFCKSKKVPPYILLFLACSVRSHITSIYSPTSDPFAILCVFTCINCMINQWWKSATLTFSVGVSINLNVCYFAPAIFMIYLHGRGPYGTRNSVLQFLLFEFIVAGPFIVLHPKPFFKTIYNHHNFLHLKESVSWQFLTEPMFQDVTLQFIIAVIYFSLMVIFVEKLWNIPLADTKETLESDSVRHSAIILIFSTTTLAVVLDKASTINHYIWYCFGLYYLIGSTSYPQKLKFLLMLTIELCWSLNEPNVVSSILLFICHYFVLMNIYQSVYLQSDTDINDLLDDTSDVKEEIDDIFNTKKDLNDTSDVNKNLDDTLDTRKKENNTPDAKKEIDESSDTSKKVDAISDRKKEDNDTTDTIKEKDDISDTKKEFDESPDAKKGECDISDTKKAIDDTSDTRKEIDDTFDTNEKSIDTSSKNDEIVDASNTKEDVVEQELKVDQ